MSDIKILVVNNYGQYCHLIHRSLRELEVDVELVSNTLTVEEVLRKEPDGIILSGGPSLERAGNSTEYVHQIDLPILGICLGHQLIARAHGGRTRRGFIGGYAAIEVEVINEDEILRGVGPKTTVWSSHSDEVSELPEGFLHLARSSECEIEAMRDEKKPVFGLQWHPEVAQSVDGRRVLTNFIEICEVGE